jgi:hypothetical protein
MMLLFIALKKYNNIKWVVLLKEGGWEFHASLSLNNVLHLFRKKKHTM